MSLDASGTRNWTGAPLVYSWREADACVRARGQKATLQLAAGLHTIWLEVSDGSGHVSRDSALVSVAAP